MNKKIISLALAVVGLLSYSELNAAVFDGNNYYELNAASASIQGPMRIMTVVGSTGSAAGVWAQIIETNTINASSYDSYSSSTKRSPALLLSTAPAVQTGYGPNSNVLLDYDSDGLFIGTTAFIFISNAPSGQANRIGLIYRKK